MYPLCAAAALAAELLNHRTPQLQKEVRVREHKKCVAEGCIELTKRNAETKADRLRLL
jgi:hypothetical protein